MEHHSCVPQRNPKEEEEEKKRMLCRLVLVFLVEEGINLMAALRLAKCHWHRRRIAKLALSCRATSGSRCRAKKDPLLVAKQLLTQPGLGGSPRRLHSLSLPCYNSPNRVAHRDEPSNKVIRNDKTAEEDTHAHTHTYHKAQTATCAAADTLS